MWCGPRYRRRDALRCAMLRWHAQVATGRTLAACTGDSRPGLVTRDDGMWNKKSTPLG